MRTVFAGICDYCRVVLQFGTAEERDAWETSHEHEGDE